ncbi:MAG TPA: hypothetical protein VKB60_03720, partial [Terriglobales bacterium]|nr:hypothetical protein [Terriglobales bacterium]
HGSTSVTLSVTDFDLEASTAAATVKAGSTATYQLTVNPKNGFNSAVSLSCSAPTGLGINCVVDSSVTVAGAPATAKLSVTTTGPAAALTHPRRSFPLYALFLFLPAVLLQGRRVPRVRKLRHLLHCIGILLLLMLAGCGGGGASNPSAGVAGVTPAGTYTVTVTARSGPLTRTTSVSLNVQ